MNNFKILFRENTTLEINGEKQTFIKGKLVGFKKISDKDTKAIRKAVIKSNTMIFTMTNDTLGCFKIVYGNGGQVKKDTVKDFIQMNKGSKKDRSKSKAEPIVEKQIEQIDEEPLTGLESNDMIESEEEVTSDEQTE